MPGVSGILWAVLPQHVTVKRTQVRLRSCESQSFANYLLNLPILEIHSFEQTAMFFIFGALKGSADISTVVGANLTTQTPVVKNLQDIV